MPSLADLLDALHVPGIYTAVFFATMYTLRSNSRRQRKSKFVTISLIVLYLLSILVMSEQKAFHPPFLRWRVCWH